MSTHHITKGGSGYVGYDYKVITVASKDLAMYLDCYESFGWIPNDEPAMIPPGSIAKLTLKRDRKIVNKAELTRLQRHFEACVEQAQALERSKGQKATAVSLVVGMIGTAFMAGSVFAVTSTPPLILLCILLAIPGFVGWGLSYPVFKRLAEKRAREVSPLIEDKIDEIHDICEKGHQLLA